MITYQEELFKDVVEEMIPIVEVHWNEIAIHKEKIKLECDWNKYIALDELDMLSTVTVRDNGVMIGYVVTLIVSHGHYMSHNFANVDAVYIDKEYRGTKVGSSLCEYAEDICKDRGASVMMHHVKVTHNFGPLLERIGYTKVEELYSKYIGD